MTPEEIIYEVGKPLTRIMGNTRLISFIPLLVSPFTWIWFEWSDAWRLGLSGLLLIVMVHVICNVVENHINRVVIQEINQIQKTKPKTKFQQKLYDMLHDNEVK